VTPVPLFALVPVRALTDAKRRLAPLLTAEERAALARAMLEDVLECLARAPSVEGIAVVTARAGESSCEGTPSGVTRASIDAPLSGDADAARAAADFGALVLPDAPEGGLNASLEAAVAWARASDAGRSLLVLPADVPGAVPEDIAALAGEDANVVLAPARDGGTNGLLLRPGAKIPFAFGPGSCAHHADAARAAGYSVALVERPGLALDLDRPEDMALYLARAGTSRTLGLLHRIGVPDRLRERAAP
jgi:2-phospho-L-lactate guanylyltransferase